MPLLSHSPLEPMNFTAHYHDGKVDLIGPTQWQDGAQGTVAKALGVKPEDVSVKTTFLGGGFGRRIDVDFIVQAAQISKAVGKPVKLLWTREDDMTHDFYRPQSVHQLAAALGDDGKPTAMTFRWSRSRSPARVRPAARGAGPADDRSGDGRLRDPGDAPRDRSSTTRACASATGARSATRSMRSPTRASSTNARPRRARIRTRTGCRC